MAFPGPSAGEGRPPGRAGRHTPWPPRVSSHGSVRRAGRGRRGDLWRARRRGREDGAVLRLLPAPPVDGLFHRVVALGAHSDDLEIGAGGTILSLLAAHPKTAVHWLVLSATAVRRDEAVSSAEALLGSSLAAMHLHEFRDGFVP